MEKERETKKGPEAEAATATTSSSRSKDFMKAFSLLSTPERRKIQDQIAASNAKKPRISTATTEVIDPRIAKAWQFDPKTGDLVHENPDRPWERFVPDEFMTPTKKTNPFTRREVILMQSFIDGMRSNKEKFIVSTKQDPKVRNSSAYQELKLLRKILATDLKKISIKRSLGMGSGRTLIHVTKLSQDLLPYSSLPGGEPPMPAFVESALGLIRLINENARYGYYGPGTYWCRNPRCLLQQCVTASATVDFGQGKTVAVDKRFLCDTKSEVIYMVNCSACKDSGTYSNHVGSSTDVARRTCDHLVPTKGKTGPQIHSKAAIEDYIKNGDDPEEFRRDSHVHFCYEHEKKGREILKLTIFQTVPVGANPRTLEHKYKELTGSYDYKGLGRGGLNAYGE